MCHYYNSSENLLSSWWPLLMSGLSNLFEILVTCSSTALLPTRRIIPPCFKLTSIVCRAHIHAAGHINQGLSNWSPAVIAVLRLGKLSMNHFHRTKEIKRRGGNISGWLFFCLYVSVCAAAAQCQRGRLHTAWLHCVLVVVMSVFAFHHLRGEGEGGAFTRHYSQ